MAAISFLRIIEAYLSQNGVGMAKKGRKPTTNKLTHESDEWNEPGK